MANEVRLIDANALEKNMRAYADNKAYCGHIELANGICKAIGRIDLAPTIDPESLRPKGRVVLKERHRGGFQIVTGTDEIGNEHTVRIDTRSVGNEPYCSACGAALADSFQDFCPRCGCKMED